MNAINSNAKAELDRCLTFIHCQLDPANPVMTSYEPTPTLWRAVTISRQVGSGGHTVAAALAGRLQAREPIHQNHPWTVIDRSLVERVLEEHHLPERLVRFMPEDRISEFNDVLDELFGLHPASLTLVEKTAETILRLAKLGNVILIGRGANIVTSQLDHVFHVRLMGSLDKRAAYIQKSRGLEEKTALELIHRGDLGRRRYLRKYYGKDIDDPLLYHLVINTGLVGYERAAAIIAQAMRSNHNDFIPVHEN